MKIYEFIDSKYSHKIKSDIYNFLFYEDNKWMFADNEEHISGIIKYVDVNIFIRIGKDISEKLNKDNITIDDYDLSKLDKYLN